MYLQLMSMMIGNRLIIILSILIIIVLLLLTGLDNNNNKFVGVNLNLDNADLISSKLSALISENKDTISAESTTLFLYTEGLQSYNTTQNLDTLNAILIWANKIGN